MGAVLDKILGEEEGGGDAAVKRQAEGFSNPMYGLANLIGQVYKGILNSWNTIFFYSRTANGPE